jgi:hypothetical protein
MWRAMDKGGYQVVYALMGKLQSDAKVSRVSLMGAPPATAKPGK